MKKILVLGCKGMAGHVIKTYLENIGNYDVWGLARGIKSENKLINLDISDTAELQPILKRESFDIVINCIGLLNSAAEKNPEKAIWLNSYLPHLLALHGEIYNFKLIHISTDCVFSGVEGGYKENHFKNGIGFYAQTKGLGEVVNSKDLTFRTSIIGPELNEDGIGLFNWFMNQNNEIFGYAEAYWSGVTTIELAEGIHQAIKQDLTGLYHFVNNNKISKFDLINHFNYFFMDEIINIIPKSDYVVDKSLLNTRTDFEYSFKCYKNMIKEMKDWILEYENLYKHYSIPSKFNK
jgi:dTDP-4-dehydrorhamnose reductase